VGASWYLKRVTGQMGCLKSTCPVMYRIYEIRLALACAAAGRRYIGLWQNQNLVPRAYAVDASLVFEPAIISEYAEFL
jgi:hypothetical protein